MTPRSTLAALAVASAVLLGACGGKSDKDLIGLARSAVASQDYAAAIIHAKSALQADAQSAEARYLLGKALLEVGDVVAASVELRKAQDLKFDPLKVSPALARALLAQGEGRQVVAQFGDTRLADAAAQAELKVSVATALLGQDQRGPGDAAIDAALAAVPGHVGATLLRARQKAVDKDIDGALQLVEQVLAANARSGEAWSLKGELLLALRRDRKGALEAYRQAVAVQPKLLQAHLAAVSLLLAEGDLGAAGTQLAELKKHFPNNARTRLLEAELAFRHKDYKTARDIGRQVVQSFPNSAQALLVAGSAEYQLGAMQQAETYLAKALQISPELTLARRVLGHLYLRTGQPQKTLAVLEPVINRNTPDIVVLQLAAEASLHLGDAKRAEELYQRAGKIKPEDTRIRTALALSDVSKGKTDAAVSQLESAAAATEGALPDLALVATHLRGRQFDKALKTIDSLEKKQPGKPLAPLLRGRVLAMKNDAAGARAAFERSAQADPNYFPATAALAAIDAAEGRMDEARKRLEAVLARDPKHVQATQALAALLVRTGDGSERVTQLLGSATKLNANDPRPHLQLIRHHLGRNDGKAALAAAKEGLAALPDHPDLLLAQGRAFMAANDMQQAITTFNRAVTLQPKSPQPLLGLADANMALKDRAAAARHLRRAVELAPRLLIAQRGLVGLALADKKPQDALDIARQVQKERPNEAVGWMLEGDVESSRKNPKGAQAAYQTAIRKSEPTEAAMRLHALMDSQGQGGEAELFAQRWITDHPKDGAFPFYLADRALAARNLSVAEVRYREVLKLQPKNALAMNNLAWLSVELKKPGAVELAEKANQLLPGRPALMDTLATALAYEKQLPRAVEIQKQAVDRAPADGGLRVNLAKLYIQSQQKALARQELEKVAQMGRQYGKQDEVQALLKTL